MFDIGWSELAVIAVVALIVIGPKDLPKALHTVGKWVAKARGLAREFQNNVDDMVRQAELDELRKQVEQARSFNLSQELEKNIDPDGKMRQSLAVEDFTSKAGDPAKPAEQARPDPEEESDLAALAMPPAGPPVTPLPASPAAVPTSATKAAAPLPAAAALPAPAAQGETAPPVAAPPADPADMPPKPQGERP